MKKMERGQQDLKGYIKENLPKGSTVAVDMNFISNDYFASLSKVLADYSLKHDEKNIVDQLWTNQPSYSKEKVIIHDLKYAGESPLQKYKRTKEKLQKSVPDVKKIALLIIRLDDIAWLTNLRGRDIEFNPVFFSFAILYSNETEEFLHLFANSDKFESENIKSHLKENNITLFSYADIYDRIQLKNIDNHLKDYLLVCDKGSLNQNLFNMISNTYGDDQSKYKLIDQDPVEHTKAVKTDREIKGLRDCNIRDGAALVKYFAWLENELVVKGNTGLTEYEAAQQCSKFRAEQDVFMGESFETISASGPNAAIIHYKPDVTSSANMRKDFIHLLDSGGQYLDGTTDTTRTVHFSIPAEKEKEMYTRVLLGNLSIQRSKFMKRWNYSGGNLDALARQYLWQVGCEFMHGTGHGVGYFLNVHEGPHGIGNYPDNPPLVHGMVVTNEPGYYLKDNFGIRIENMLVVIEGGEDNSQLSFENLTMVPYENSLLDFSLLSEDFISFINGYHKEVYEKLHPLVKDDKLALDYLSKKTAPIKKP